MAKPYGEKITKTEFDDATQIEELRKLASKDVALIKVNLFEGGMLSSLDFSSPSLPNHQGIGRKSEPYR